MARNILKRNLRIGQINLGRGKQATDCLIRNAILLGVDVLLVQEPYVYRGRIIGYPPGSRIFSGALKEKWAAVVVLNPELGAVTISQVTEEHAAVVEISYRGRTYIFGSVYCQFSLPVEPFLEKMKRIIRLGGGRHVYIGTDVNSKSPRWGGGVTDPRGRLVEGMIDDADLLLLNDPNKRATYSSTRGESWIDVTLASRGTSRWSRDWTVHDTDISDHRLVTWNIPAGANNIRHDQVEVKLNWRRINWDLFASEVCS